MGTKCLPFEEKFAGWLDLGLGLVFLLLFLVYFVPLVWDGMGWDEIEGKRCNGLIFLSCFGLYVVPLVWDVMG